MSPSLYHVLVGVIVAQLLKATGEKREDGLLNTARLDSHEIDFRGLTTPRVARSWTDCSLEEVILSYRTSAVRSIGSYRKNEKYRG